MARDRDAARRDLTLLLIGLNSLDESGRRRCWKNLDFDTLDALQDDALIEGSPRSKSIWLTDRGVAEVARLAAEYGIADPFPAPAAGPEQLQIRLELDGVTPVVWRRLVIPFSTSGLQLHRAIQAVFGWQDKHLHVFEIHGERFGINFEGMDPDMRPSKDLKIGTLWTRGVREIAYTYDFGDDWQCRVHIEGQRRGLADTRFAVLDGAEPAPPEDSGGAHGYMDMRKRAKSPRTADDRELASWLEGFPPDPFDRSVLNERLRRLK
jgi:hypothetical protein